MSLGKRIKNLLFENNMTGVELANKLDISSSVISKYINNNDVIPKADILFKISSYFDVSMEFLLTGYEVNHKNMTDPLWEKINKLNDKDKIKIEGMIDMYLSEYNQSSYTSANTENKVG
jgi:transcriptional regulator with XRE-family HTH domain